MLRPALAVDVVAAAAAKAAPKEDPETPRAPPSDLTASPNPSQESWHEEKTVRVRLRELEPSGMLIETPTTTQRTVTIESDTPEQAFWITVKGALLRQMGAQISEYDTVFAGFDLERTTAQVWLSHTKMSTSPIVRLKTLDMTPVLESIWEPATWFHKPVGVKVWIPKMLIDGWSEPFTCCLRKVSASRVALAVRRALDGAAHTPELLRSFVHHDIGNLLMSLSGAFSALRAQRPVLSRAERSLFTDATAQITMGRDTLRTLVGQTLADHGRPPPTERIDVRALLKDIVVLVRSSSCVPIKVSVHDETLDAKGTIVASRQTLKMMLYNLANNAVKFTHEGRIILHAKITDPSDASDAGDVHATTFTVTDTGCGIPKDRLASIFEYGTSSLSTGVGLHMVKFTCAQVFDTAPFVESTVDRGTTVGFTVRTPKVAPKNDEERRPRSGAATAATTTKIGRCGAWSSTTWR